VRTLSVLDYISQLQLLMRSFFYVGPVFDFHGFAIWHITIMLSLHIITSTRTIFKFKCSIQIRSIWASFSPQPSFICESNHFRNCFSTWMRFIIRHISFFNPGCKRIILIEFLLRSKSFFIPFCSYISFSLDTYGSILQ